MTNIQGDQKLGEIVASLPEAITVFKKFNIDFCCGGHRTLHEAAKEQGIGERTVLAELNSLSTATHKSQSQTDWRAASLTELVNHIVDTHHSFLRRELPIVGELTEKIMTVHGTSHAELTRIDHLFCSLRKELEEHLETEEKVLYPMIVDYDQNPSKENFEKVQSVIGQLESEHEKAGDILKELRKISDQYTVPSDGCMSYKMAYRKLEELEDDLFRHIHLENNILHPRTIGLLKNH